nr:immunoglobulin light chain junction region [Macaca mulatta]
DYYCQSYDNSVWVF